MAPYSVASGSNVLLTQLAAAAVRTILLAAGTGLLLSLFRLKDTSLRLFAWTAVLYVGLSMPILGWLLPPVSIAIPFPTLHVSAKLTSANEGTFASVKLPRADQFIDGKNAGQNGSVTRGTKVAVPHDPHVEGVRVSSWISFWPSIQWVSFAAAVYGAIAIFLFFRLVAGVRFSKRLVRSSNPVQDLRIVLRLSSGSYASSWRKLPRIYESPLASVPVTIGVIAPAILLPRNWQKWDDAKLDAVITHEMSHVIRGDAVSQYVSLIYRAIFWFSPLAWWLNRYIAELAEEASDEAALAAGTERDLYARTLLGFFQAVKDAPGRIQWQGVSMAKADQAQKRLEKILVWRGDHSMRLKRSVIAMVVAFAIPAIYMAAAARPVAHNQPSQNTTSIQGQAPPSPTGTPSEPQLPASDPAAPVLPPPPADGGVSNSGPLPAQPVSPVAPPTPASPAESQEQDSAKNYRHGFSYAYGFDDEQRFVIVSGKSDRFTMSGTSEDARHVEKLKKRIPGDFIWFQWDEKSYIIRDQATVDRARQLWAPQEELGRKQEELGKQQEALGKQQEELGARMQQVRVKVPDITAELDKLKAELQQLGADASMEQIGAIQARMGELQAKIGELQAHAGDEQGKFGTEMGALGEQQGKLGEQQGELGRQQAELAQKASRAMKQLLDDAIKKGIAQPEPPEPGSAL